MTAAAAEVLLPGLYENVDHDAYHRDPCEYPSLSSSIAHVLIEQSPLHAHLRHPRLGGGGQVDPSKAMDRGTMIHKMLLGRGQDFAEIEEASYKTHAAQRQRDGARADGLIPVLSHELADYSRIAGIYREKLRKHADRIEFTGATELTGVFMQNGVLCRMRLDHWNGAELIIDDIKTSKTANPTDLGNVMVHNGTDIQAAAYTSGMGILVPEALGRVRIRFIYLEATPPFDVVVAEPDGQMLDLGRRKWKRAIDRWAGCLGSGSWPGYASGTVRVSPPAWAVNQDLDRALNQAQLPPPPF